VPQKAGAKGLQLCQGDWEMVGWGCPNKAKLFQMPLSTNFSSRLLAIVVLTRTS